MSLDSSPTYEALSFTWGFAEHKQPIILDGANTEISQNLSVALQYLRNPREARTLWVDAICIDQDDPYQKSYQVRLMGEIYRRASRVLIWLGPEVHGGEYSVEILSSLSLEDIKDTN